MMAPYTGTMQLTAAGFYTLTYTSLLLIYLSALAIQSAYQVRLVPPCHAMPSARRLRGTLLLAQSPSRRP